MAMARCARDALWRQARGSGGAAAWTSCVHPFPAPATQDVEAPQTLVACCGNAWGCCAADRAAPAARPLATAAAAQGAQSSGGAARLLYGSAQLGRLGGGVPSVPKPARAIHSSSSAAGAVAPSHQPWLRLQPSGAALRFCHNKQDASTCAAGVLSQLLQQRPFCVGPDAQLEPAVYTIDVFTGDVRGAGSPMTAQLQLIGSEGESEPIVFGQDDPDAPGFSRGSHRTLQVEAPANLGELRRVVVRQQKPGVSDIGVGWFLDSVEVTGPGEASWRFPCGRWLGKSDAGDFVGETVRNLIPTLADSEEVAEYLAEPLEVATAAMVVPHPEKVSSSSKARIHRDFGFGGEDAYYCAWGPRNAVLGLGVSDGVYMWRSRGIDSGVFSRSLMLSSKNAVEYGQVDVLNVLKEAAETVEENGIQGSATCCLVLVDTLQGRLTSANIGDSGFLLIGSTLRNRKPHIKFHSPQQEHTFGFPYQLGHQVNADKPCDAMLANIPVVAGDVLVLGSDGLWDNVADDEVLDIVTTAGSKQEGPQPAALAQALARAAFYNSLDKKRTTPYSLGATEAFDMVFNGGKQDDISVVVATFSGEMAAGKVEGLGRHGL